MAEELDGLEGIGDLDDEFGDQLDSFMDSEGGDDGELDSFFEDTRHAVDNPCILGMLSSNKVQQLFARPILLHYPVTNVRAIKTFNEYASRT